MLSIVKIPEEVPLLSDFIYEAIYTPEGYTRPSKDIVNTPEMHVYVRDFGKRSEDIGLAAVMSDRVVGAEVRYRFKVTKLDLSRQFLSELLFFKRDLRSQEKYL